MVQTAFDSSKDVDLVLFMIEATSKEIGKGDSLILDKIKEAKKKTILLINKIDLVKKEERPPILFIIARRGEKVNGKKAVFQKFRWTGGGVVTIL